MINPKVIYTQIRIAGISIFLLAGTIVSAQTEKGKYLVGGSGDLSETIQYTTSTFNLGLQPIFGVFVIRNLALGGTYSFSVSSARTYNSGNKTHTTNTTIQPLVGPFIKYYLGKKPLKGVAMADAGYTVYTHLKSTSSNSTSASITNYDGFAAGGSMGIAYFFNNYISLESGLYVNAAGYKTQIPSTRFGFFLGVYTFLDKKKQE